MQKRNAKLTLLILSRITHHPLYTELGADVTTRQAAYRALFRSQLDDEAIADIRALSQGQPLGSDRFSDAMRAAVGIRGSRKRPGRPAASPDQTSGTETQPDFGF